MEQTGQSHIEEIDSIIAEISLNETPELTNEEWQVIVEALEQMKENHFG